MTFEQVAPILPVRDVAAALAHYAQLGFEGTVYKEVDADGRPFYGFLWRDGINLHVTRVPDLDPLANTCAAYLYVDDPDALYAEWRALVPVGTLRKPSDTPWRMREMRYSDPDGNLLRIGCRAGTGAA